MRKIMPANQIYFITNRENYFNVLNQIKNIDKNFSKEQILVEPKSLNTAPALAYAIKYLAEVARIDINAPIIALASDHYIGDIQTYLKLVKTAMSQLGDHLGTIGITPTSPHTGYGYIKKGKKIDNYYQAEKYVEKPDKLTAQNYLASGEYVWNAGMFLFNIKTLANEFYQHAPEIYSLLSKNFSTFKEEFATLPKISLDYAVAEKSNNIIVFEGDFGWSDIGSFDSLSEITHNKSQANHLSINSQNIFVKSDNGRLIVTSGVNDLIVVDSHDSILIQKKGESENVKKIVEHLEKNEMKEIEHNLIVHRPWGKYEVLIEKSNHKVRKVTVYPGEKIGLQSHLHRAEHWIIIKGTAKVYNKDREIILSENESTFIPARSWHRLENIGKINLEIIEVHTGDYLEEDDIVRYDDVYNR